MTADEEGPGNGVARTGRGHDLLSFTGVAFREGDDPRAVTHGLRKWSSTIDIDGTPALDDEETRAVWRARA